MTSPPKAERVLDCIRRDAYSDVEVASIYRTCAESMVRGAVGLRWVVSIPAFGVEFNEDDLTLNDAATIKRRVGVSTGQLDLVGDATHFMAVVWAFVVNHLGWDDEAADQKIGSIPINEAAELVSMVAVKADPKGPRAVA